MNEKKEVIHTRIWNEEPDSKNPFAASKCYCSGYDVYGDLLGQISWIEYLFLLLRLELPSPEQAKTLEMVAVAIANPGIRDHSVRAAMNGGVAGSTRASSLIAALSVGAGNLNGGREVHEMLRLWFRLGCDLKLWFQWLENPEYENEVDVWRPMEHVPGFDPNGVSCCLPVLQTLEKLASAMPGAALEWLMANRKSLESQIGYPLTMSGVIAAALFDLGFNASQAEMLYLLLRLPGAAAHSLEQETVGWNRYPFFGDVIKPKSDSEYKELLLQLDETK